MEALNNVTGAVIVEVVEGEGGVNPGAREYLLGLQELCDQQGAMLIVDEVHTGFGRTGALCACQHHGLEPDLLCLGKGIAGGLPMGAIAIGENVKDLPKSVHGSTFGGNPLACAASLAALETYQIERLSQRSAELGTYLIERLSNIPSPLIREVRGMGLMVGVDLRIRVAPVLKALQEKGILALPAGPTILRLLPPLVISKEELDMVIMAIDEILVKMAPSGIGVRP